MNRVTYWNEEYDCWSYHCSISDAAKLLAAYEDTGLEPREISEAADRRHDCKIDCLLIAYNALLEEIEGLGGFENLRYLSQAEKDGRLVVHGRWINAYISGVNHLRCSVCGEYTETVWHANFDYNFCPNCGAKMDLKK